MAKYMIDNRTEPIDFECEADMTKRTLQNCKNLIMCRMGEVPYDRNRGINPAIFDMPIVQLNEVLLPEIDRVFGWEPDAKAISAEAYLDDIGETIISVIVEIKQ